MIGFMLIGEMVKRRGGLRFDPKFAQIFGNDNPKLLMKFGVIFLTSFFFGFTVFLTSF